jgi:two-component system response regulator RstA
VEGPIVLLTSLDSDMNHILSLEMGANDYILKTTPPAVLLARLRLHFASTPARTRSAGAVSDAAQSDALRYAVY